MEVVVGTYNNILFGFSFNIEQTDDTTEAWKFKPLFTDQNHTGCIKTVSAGGRYLASGSTDDTIRLFDMKKHVEVGTLVEQDGTITSLVFCGTTHMLSGSEDGTICIWKTKTWELEKTMKGHKGSINALSVHPSGRLALSVSKDKSIRTWNLLTGRTAYTTGIKEIGELVQWSPTGDAYAIVVGAKVTVYKIKGVNEPIVYTCDKYILSMVFLNEEVLLLAGESDDIILYNFEKKLVLQRLAAHKVRTKGVAVTPYPGEEDKVVLFTVASDGNLKAWSLNKNDFNEEATLLASLDMPGRPTCVAVSIQTPQQKAPTKTATETSEDVEIATAPSVETEKSSESMETSAEATADGDTEETEETETDITDSKSDISTTGNETPVAVKAGKKNKSSSGSEMKGLKKKKKKTVSVGD